MQSIGQGIQFEVFIDKNTPGRLLKIPNDVNSSLQVLNKWEISKDMSSDQKYKWAERSVSNTMKWSHFFVDLISKHPELKPHLAYPEFRDDGSYTQDRVVTIGDYLKTNNRQDARRIFQLYAESIIYDWKFSFSDGVFNPTQNSGVDKNGNVVLIDFLEINIEKDVLRQKINNEVWLTRSSYISDIPEPLRDDYRAIMKKTITTSKLEDNWGKII